MKSNITFSIIILIICFFPSFSNGQIIKLQVQENHEYIFEKVDKIYLKTMTNNETELSKNSKEIKLTINKIVLGESINFSFQFLKNIHEEESIGAELNRTDYFFPDFSRSNEGFPDLNEGLLCRSVLKFSLNLQNNEIILVNKDELIESYRTRLYELNYDDNQTVSFISNISEKKWFIDDELVSFLTWFNNSEITGDNAIINLGIPEKLMVVEKSNEFVNLGNHDFDKIISGRILKKFWVNIDNGIITNYSSIRFDSIQSFLEKALYKGVWKVFETNFRFLYSQPVPQQKLFLSGKIENPLSNKIHIRFLDAPFDVNLKTKTVILDKSGSFSTSFDYVHSGFLYVENENNNKHNPPGTYVFYTEPGDSIYFESKGSQLPWQTVVSGTRPTEQKLIQELREEIKKPGYERNNTGRSNIILDNEFILTGVAIYDENINRAGEAEPVFKAIENAENICLKYKSEISEKSFNFIMNEVKTYFYSALFNFGRIIIRYKGIAGNLQKDLELLTKIDQIKLHDIYNDFGLESRKCVFSYISFHIDRIKKIQYRYSSDSGSTIRINEDPELDLQFSRLVLTGSPLYRNIAQNMVQIIERRSLLVSPQTDENYLENFTLQNIDLLTQKSNDLELVEKLKQIREQYWRLKSGNFVPDIDFINIQNQKVSFNDFFNGRPTIFYFSSDWSGDRYEYDMMAEGMPELNYVMVIEGSNFKQWEEYTKRAEPVAKHLLYINDKKTFKDIFQKNSIFLVFDKNGELVGNAFTPKGAARLAVDSLDTTKQLNKSQLKFIILILVTILLIFMLGVLIWKWRVQQRFRREQQQRRLRELELTAIRSQMNPHFLFNSLNSVQNLVQQNKGREAHLYLADFAGLIRKVLQNSEKEEVSLAEELEMVQQYLNLEKLRFDFDFSISVTDDIDANNTMVPSLLLQPFAENAIIHGLQNKPGNKQLKIEVSREKSGIKINIDDNGVGREAAKQIAATKNGKGSKLMKERLEILQQKQGEKYHLEIMDITGEQTGTSVEIIIPEEK